MLHYFGSFTKSNNHNNQPDADQDSDSVSEIEHAQTLMWVHQEAWQKDLLIKYGNTINTHRCYIQNNKYELPLFLFVKTNVNHTVVWIAEFIVQSEGGEDIASEALRIIRNWNTNWCLPFFMMHYSATKLLAVNTIFPQCTV